MHPLLVLGLVAQLTTSIPRIQQTTLEVSDVGTVRYGLSVPRDYDVARPRPLVLALHPGGGRTAFYGAGFMRSVVAPALAGLQPIIIAPDCPTRGWNDPVADKAVMALVQHILETYAIDRQRILVTGFSMGGRGTWYFSSQHPELFTAAIPMAAPGDEAPDRLAKMPTYIIHSRDDEVVPFGPAERRAKTLEQMGRTVSFEVLEGLGHYQMGGYVESLRRGGQWVAARWDK